MASTVASLAPRLGLLRAAPALHSAATASNAKAELLKPGVLCPVSSRPIVGKALREEVAKPKPWPYWKHSYNILWSFFDRTTLRWDENSKLVVVDGAHGVGKTQFAQELAEELGMKYMGEPSLDSVYKSPYGESDVRDYKHLMWPRCRPYDEKDFVRDPTGPVEGCGDRFLRQRFEVQFSDYVLALRHIFNTGQGVVIEKSPYTEYLLWEAAFNAGWIKRPSLALLREMWEVWEPYLLRPNLIIYLDAPVEVAQKKVLAKGHEWDQNSPLWKNKQFLNDIYTGMKRDYLKKVKSHSQVLVYDWSEPGETEVVVEDIEKLNFDYYGLYELDQKDWRFYTDDLANAYRIRVSCDAYYIRMLNAASNLYHPDAVDMWYTPHEVQHLNDVSQYIRNHRYRLGYNEKHDGSVLFRTSHHQEHQSQFWKWAGVKRPQSIWEDRTTWGAHEPFLEEHADPDKEPAV